MIFFDINNNKRENSLDFNSQRGALSPKTKKKIRLIVISFHVGLLSILIISYLISLYVKDEKPIIIQVKLVEPTNIIRNSSQTMKNESLDTRALPPSKSINKVKPKRSKTTKKKVRKKSIKKRRELLSATEINVSKKVIQNKRTPKLQKIKSIDIEKNLSKLYRSNRIKAKSTQGTIASSRTISQNYADKLFSAIYRAWKQPAKSELHGRRPVVDIEITIAPNGRVVNSRILKKSGVSVMDYSAKQLLANLKKLPSSKNGKQTFTVSLEIID